MGIISDNLKLMKKMQSSSDIYVCVSLSDLQEWHREIMEEAKKQESDPVYIDANAACKILGVTKPTLWRYEKDKMLTHNMVGGRRMYLKEDVHHVVHQGRQRKNYN